MNIVCNILLAILTLVIAVSFYYRSKFKFWQNQGLNGPRAYPLLGSIGSLMLDPDAGTRWMKEFGKVFGVYSNSKPVLVVADPEVLREICIKHFNSFPSHPIIEFGSELSRKFIFNATGDQWRHHRAVMTPAFTSVKIRRMHKVLEVCADNLLEALDERLKSNRVINLKDLFGLYTMDAIASCCYGVRMASYKADMSLASAARHDEFVRLGMNLFNLAPWRIAVYFLTPNCILKMLNFHFLPSDSEQAFARNIQQIIRKRRESDQKFDDYLQALIDAGSNENGSLEATQQYDEKEHLDSEFRRAGDFEPSRQVAETTNSKDSQLSGLKERPLDEVEILSSATFLLIVALESTSTLLTFCVYALSFHQEIQEKLYQTVKSLVNYKQNKATFDYDSLIECPYLDAVVSETLRKHPPVIQTDRCASQDFHLVNYNLHISKGTRVMLAYKAIMEDPDNWSQPQAFDPERFMPSERHKIKPYSYCPFGIGPRHCLGMRFSLAESKLALAKLILEYRFEPAQGTKYPPEIKLAMELSIIKRPEVVAIKRESLSNSR